MDRQGPEAIRVAIVGCGIRGQLFATALAQAPDATVLAVADTDVGRAQELASTIGASPYSSVEAMLDHHPDLDAAIVATPDVFHVDAAVACAARGLDLMIEKPLATDLLSAQRIAEAASANRGEDHGGVREPLEPPVHRSQAADRGRASSAASPTLSGT